MTRYTGTFVLLGCVTAWIVSPPWTALAQDPAGPRQWSWGSGDEQGAGNLVTPESILETLSQVTRGEIIALSPDDRRVAVALFDEGTSDIWVYDVERKIRDRLTREGMNQYPVWSPTGDRIAFASRRTGSNDSGLYWRASDGGSDAESMLARPFLQLPMHWFKDAETLSFVETTPA